MPEAAAPPDSPGRILVIRLSALGDVIRTLPLLPPLRARFPDASLAWLCEPLAYPVLARQPLLSRVLQFPRGELSRAAAGGRFLEAARRTRRLLAELREARFELVLDAQGTYKSGALTLLSGAPRRIGFARGAAREYLPGAATERVDPGAGLSRVQRALELLRPLGADPGLAAASLPVSEGEAARAAELWTAAGSPPRILLAPGASHRQDYKRWPARRFGLLAAALRRRGMTVRIAWGPGEEDLAREGADAAAEPELVLPATTLLELAELCRGADLFVGNDSGPMHLAWLTGTRVVALYGPTDPVLNAPWGEGHVQVAVPWPAETPRPRDPDLMQRLEVDEVECAVLGALAAPRRPPAH